jgi:hypothetical protein
MIPLLQATPDADCYANVMEYRIPDSFCAGVASPIGVAFSNWQSAMIAYNEMAAFSEDQEEMVAEAELAKITPVNADLLRMAERFPAPQAWYDE